MSDCCIKNCCLVILGNVKGCGWETVPVLHWLHLSSLFFTLLSLSFFLSTQFSSYPIHLVRQSISTDGSSIQRHSLRSQFQAKNGNFVVLQSVSSTVAVFNYFCLQASLEKATEKTLAPWQLFRGDLLHTVTRFHPCRWTYRMSSNVDIEVIKEKTTVTLICT